MFNIGSGEPLHACARSPRAWRDVARQGAPRSPRSPASTASATSATASPTSRTARERARLRAAGRRSTTGWPSWPAGSTGQAAVDRVGAGERRARRAGADAYERSRQRIARHGAHRSLITGGAGFIGTNLAHRCSATGRPVLHLRQPVAARRRAEPRLAARRRTATRLERRGRRRARSRPRCAAPSRGARRVFHFAAQVAVTTSLVDPRDDFDVNARGTLNVLEALARAGRAAAARLHVDEQGLRRRSTTSRCGCDGQRYAPADGRVARARHRRGRGRSTSTARTAARRAPPTSTCSTTRAPTACRRVVFRMSCIYGPHQFGTEDQGWVAHFLIRALERRADHDLRRRQAGARHPVRRRPRRRLRCAPSATSTRLAGQAFNIGGGPGNVDQPARAARPHRGAARHAGRRSRSRTGAPATSATTSPTRARSSAATGWRPRVGVDAGHRARCTAGCVERATRRPRPVAPRCADGAARRHGARAASAPDGAPRGDAIARRGCRCSRRARRRAGRRERGAARRRGPDRCCCGSRAAACAARTCRCGRAAPWFDVPAARRARRATKAGAASPRSATASTGSRVGDRVAALSTARTPSTTSPRPSAVVPLPAALDGVAVPGRAARLRRSTSSRRSGIEAGQTVAIVGIGFLGALLDAARRRTPARA